jgi:hypothetical protein
MSFQLSSYVIRMTLDANMYKNALVLQEHAKSDKRRSNSDHKKKRAKMETVTWCCPICGADAMWPQLVVDGVLLRYISNTV